MILAQFIPPLLHLTSKPLCSQSNKILVSKTPVNPIGVFTVLILIQILDTFRKLVVVAGIVTVMEGTGETQIS